jgi:hypothetical protein
LIHRGCCSTDWKRAIEAFANFWSIYFDGKASSQSENEHEAKNKSGSIAHVGTLAGLTEPETVTVVHRRNAYSS